MGLYRFEVFAGAGGGILGGIMHRQRCIGAIEKDPYRQAVLLQRQKDKILPWFSIWDDVTTFRYDNPDCKEYIESLRSIRDRLIISGGFPCQDISTAGKGAGIDGKKSGLFFEFARIVSEIRPAYWFMENSPALIIRGFDRVLREISEMGYNARWGVVGADNAGAPHQRKRIWILAYTSDKQRATGTEKQGIFRKMQDIKNKSSNTNGSSQALSNTDGKRSQAQREPRGFEPEKSEFDRCDKVKWWDIDPADIPNADEIRLQTSARGEESPGGRQSNREYWRPAQPRLGRMAHGIPDRVDRIKAIGDGQVPEVEKIAWELLGGEINEQED